MPMVLLWFGGYVYGVFQNGGSPIAEWFSSWKTLLRWDIWYKYIYICTRPCHPPSPRGLDCSVLCDGCACQEIDQSISETCMHKSKYYVYKCSSYVGENTCVCIRHTDIALHYITLRYVTLHYITKHNITDTTRHNYILTKCIHA